MWCGFDIEKVSGLAKSIILHFIILQVISQIEMQLVFIGYKGQTLGYSFNISFKADWEPCTLMSKTLIIYFLLY